MGVQCTSCEPLHFGFSSEGCKLCDCDLTGSTNATCNIVTGQCPCRDKVEGRRCNRCMENTHSKDTGGVGEKICEPCDDCYNLVSDAVNEHRENLETLDKLLDQIAKNPQPVEENFNYELKGLSVRVKANLADAKISSQNEDGGTLRDRLHNLNAKLDEVLASVSSSNAQISEAKEKSVTAKQGVENAKSVIDEARESLKVSTYLFRIEL